MLLFPIHEASLDAERDVQIFNAPNHEARTGHKADLLLELLPDAADQLVEYLLGILRDFRGGVEGELVDGAILAGELDLEEVGHHHLLLGAAEFHRHVVLPPGQGLQGIICFHFV